MAREVEMGEVVLTENDELVLSYIDKALLWREVFNNLKNDKSDSQITSVSAELNEKAKQIKDIGFSDQDVINLNTLVCNRFNESKKSGKEILAEDILSTFNKQKRAD